ncbi:hypothetical protein SLA2020_281480 [Shorea laevis]
MLKISPQSHRTTNLQYGKNPSPSQPPSLETPAEDTTDLYPQLKEQKTKAQPPPTLLKHKLAFPEKASTHCPTSSPPSV